MAQLVFSTLGQNIGSAVLPNGISVFGQQISGAAIGQFVGSVAGAAVDSYLLAPRLEGPRISEVYVTESREGAFIPRAYGRVRVGGNVIWAARFKEQKHEEGGKGGPSQTNYSYSLSFAVGLCEGEVSSVSRIWANGEEIDLSQINWRLHRGSKEQLPDALIEAIEGHAPAYRGLAYVVFEDLPLDAYGMRMPQLSFEIMRPVKRDNIDLPRMEDAIESVNLIPGSGEFAYATTIVRRVIGEGEETAENMHNATGNSNFVASVDQLVAELPNLKHVNLIVGWFGNDLRCGECLIRPGVEISEKENVPLEWRVAGETRSVAYQISQDENGRANYGGTPSDETVVEAIRELKERGIEVTVYPFLFMDIPKDNGLPDPYGKNEQSVFPWRGRITCTNGSDATALAGGEVEDFFGNGVDDWRYKQFIRHYAELAVLAGGVHAFLIGAEMVGLSRIRSARGVYPAADKFSELADQVRGIVGPDCKISYAADWTEYGAYVPEDGQNDTDFPLDELWANANIDFIGVDWYPPMADWRAIDGHLDQLAGWKSIYDVEYLQSNIEGGEAYDWYYANDIDRSTQSRTPIQDGGYNEHWVYRQKDIRNWHASTHTPRRNGVKQSQSTSWIAGSKPIRFVEFGCSAVDMGPNQPNVFYDPKSSESALPHYSSGSRDDVIQRNMIEAFCAYWKADELLDEHGISIWAWDARPFPAWPRRSDIWGDGGNWNFGHWLNGRVGLALLRDVVTDLTNSTNLYVDVDEVFGLVSGYVIDRSMSIRDSLEPLKSTYGFHCTELETGLRIRNSGFDYLHFNIGDFVVQDEGFIRTRPSMEQNSDGVRLRYIDALAEYLPAIAMSGNAIQQNYRDVSLPLVMDESSAVELAKRIHDQVVEGKEAAKISGSLQFSEIEAGDYIRFSEETENWFVDKVRSSKHISIELSVPPKNTFSLKAGSVPSVDRVPILKSPAIVEIVDAPPLPSEEDDARPLVFASMVPWQGEIEVLVGVEEGSFSKRAILSQPCIMGRLASSLPLGHSSRWMEHSVDVQLISGKLESASRISVLNGANAALIETDAGWEMLQFQNALLIAENTYRLSKFIRGQQGSDSTLLSAIESGARIVFLDGSHTRLNLNDSEVGLDLKWKIQGEQVIEDTSIGRSLVWQQKALQQWSPVHLKVAEVEGGLSISWVRRGRKSADNWELSELPREIGDDFKIEIKKANTSVREWTSSDDNFVYSNELLNSDFAIGETVMIEVRQLGINGMYGHPAKAYYVN